MDAVSGKCPPAFANLVRQLLINKDKDLETITKFTGITTAKGRQQNREIQKRKVRAWMV